MTPSATETNPNIYKCGATHRVVMLVGWFVGVCKLRCLRRWLMCVAGWFALLIGLRCLLVCFVGRFALLVGLRCWLVCVAALFAVLVGLCCRLVCVAGVRQEGEGGDGLGLENENPPTA